MNCFVIMPFATDFDDVYEIIKTTVKNLTADGKGRCFRLDESRPAGRITDRLLNELRSATICVADITENKPNVMWELGFAMALGKPTIIITQNIAMLPFDIKDMQSIEYNRTRLSATLTTPLRQSLLDTLGSLSNKPVAIGEAEEVTVGALLSEIAQLKNIVAEAVNAWRVDEPKVVQPQVELQALVGHWFNTESRSNVYMKIIRGELVAPYCFGGNSDLTGVYFGWKRTGEYWFARYQWINSSISGFTFLRMESLEKMTGAWWYAEQEVHGTDSPPQQAGVAASWKKKIGTETPDWVKKFFMEIEQEGLASYLVKQRVVEK
jgi:nucleoside 2-deoxyribosyltransferase